ncbi:MAG: transposase [Candidatus Thiodiazotropha sp. (ex Ctena orbiculata)]|nr:transposase [Candidatus Thiodiazotropha taylori]
MTISRKNQICLEETPYYHCVSRCVRRAFLCGEDRYTGRSYTHRRAWVVDLLKHLSEVFAIDICAYAVMHNHTHIVFRVDRERALAWGSGEVVTRWTALYKPSPVINRYLGGLKLSKAEKKVVAEDVEKWRHRLYDISWFMRNLNENIARRANEEDKCTGRFWEGRFKSQALLDDAALLTCMSYVDLNPIRAGIADTLKNSDFTSIQERIRDYHQSRSKKECRTEAKVSSPNRLFPLIGGEHQINSHGLSFCLQEYLKLTDWAGQAFKEDKACAIPTELAPILVRLNIDSDAWLESLKNFSKNYYTVVGTQDASKEYSLALGRKWFCMTRSSRQLYGIVSA